MRRRTGTTLVELLVALPVSAIVGVIAVALLLDSNRTSRRIGASTQIGREMRQAVAVLASEIRPLSANDLVAWTDTSIEMNAVVGSGVVCATTGTSIDMLPLNGTETLRTAWFSTPQSGDLVFTQALDSSITHRPTAWSSAPLSSVTTSSTSSCLTSPHMLNGTGSGNAVRLSASALSRPPALGSLVRIARRVRYSLYKASDGLWYLGRKSFNGASWTTVQPVAGPFDKPLARGLYIEVRDSSNALMTAASTGTPRSVALAMHASSAWKKSATTAGVRDSVLMHIALRGQMQVTVP